MTVLPRLACVTAFMDAIVVAPTSVFNPWADHASDDIDIYGPMIRRRNLVDHLDIKAPALVLIGEAPGYRGCRISGVPFTSERQIVNGSAPRMTLRSRISRAAAPWAEPSATIVWSLLRDTGMSQSTVLWNACPWHPYNDKPQSNRAPTSAELEAGMPALRLLLEMFPEALVIPVGRVAASVIDSARPNRAAEPVRHPAFGGAPQFRAGVIAHLKARGVAMSPPQASLL